MISSPKIKKPSGGRGSILSMLIIGGILMLVVFLVMQFYILMGPNSWFTKRPSASGNSKSVDSPLIDNTQPLTADASSPLLTDQEAAPVEPPRPPPPKCKQQVPHIAPNNLVRVHGVSDAPAPSVSVVFVTKRPGGYDILFQSLAQQTSQDYEVICIDELAPYRRAGIIQYARALGVNLAAVSPSKTMTDDKRFRIASALNTGFLLSRGKYVLVVMDYAWLPPTIVERTIQFYKEHPKSFLAYPERFYGMDHQKHGVMPGSAQNGSLLTIFKEEMTLDPAVDKARWTPYYFRPEYVFKGPDKEPVGVPSFTRQTEGIFWELSCASAPWEAIAMLNGVDEALDVGDDCHEVNLRLRAELVGYDTWLDEGSIVSQIQHRGMQDSYLWTRYAKDNNWDLFQRLLGKIRENSYPLSAPHAFDLKMYHEEECIRLYDFVTQDMETGVNQPPSPVLDSKRARIDAEDPLEKKK